MLVTKVKRLTLQQNITLLGVSMKLALLGRQALMGAMAVVLMTGVSVKTFAAENLLNQVKERGTLRVGLEGTGEPPGREG